MKITANLSEINTLCRYVCNFLEKSKVFNRTAEKVLVKLNEATGRTIFDMIKLREIELNFSDEEFLVFAYISTFGYKLGG